MGFPNDIALVRLDRDAEFNAYVQPIEMASMNAPAFTGSECFITGWGKIHGKPLKFQLD